MTLCQSNATAQARPEPFRWSRRDAVAAVADFHDPDAGPRSQRQFAQQQGVPRSTLQHWLDQAQHPDLDPLLVAFFESPVGLTFLKQLLAAAHLVFHQAGPSGLRPLLTFFELAGLAPFVACSFGTHHALAAHLQELLLRFGAEERQRLGPAMPPKRITLCEDENFHRTQPCLVAIEPVSNFILVETHQPHRDAATWDQAVKQATTGLPVTVVQVTSDLAKGLLAHAKDGLGAHHSPDLMHVQQDLHRATGLPLQKQVQRTQEELQEYREWEQRVALAREAYEQGPSRPGRPPDFAGRLATAQAFQDGAQKRLAIREQRQEQVAGAIRGLGDDYHPFDRHSGAAVEVEELRRRLEARFGVIEAEGEQAALPPSSWPKINKARRVLPALVATLAWFWAQTQELGRSLALDSAQQEWFEQRVLPAAYWQQAAERGRDAADRQELRALAERLQSTAWSEGARPRGLNAEAERKVRAVAQECVERWVRSSSCVEGRNGLLALRHHGKHGLSEQRLQALTVLHNYWVKRPDDTTAAERFFGQKPRDLFAWLLERLPDPPRPAKRPAKRQPGTPCSTATRPNR